MATGIPTLGDIPLLLPSSEPSSGAAFELNKPAHADANVPIGPWEVEVRKGLKLVVARGGDDRSYEDAFRAGLLHAQQGLDLFCARGAGDLSITAFDEQHVAWWTEPRLVVRVVSLAPMAIRIGPVTLEVRDAEGNLVPPSPGPPVVWHESFRYFRLSQTSDDLFDAYRNAYLALESILSDIAPQYLKSNGKPGEGEGQWFARALRAAGRIVPLTDFVPSGATDAHEYLYDELYKDMRSAMSHAKSGRKVLLPRDKSERQRVTDSLLRLVQFYLKLVEAHLGMRRLGGAMSAVAFETMHTSLLDSMKVYATDEESPHDSDGTDINPSGRPIVELAPVGAVDTSTPFLATKLLSAAGEDVAVLPFIRTVAGAGPKGEAWLTTILEGRLILGTAAYFEALVGMRGINADQPKSRYSF